MLPVAKVCQTARQRMTVGLQLLSATVWEPELDGPQTLICGECVSSSSSIRASGSPSPSTGTQPWTARRQPSAED